MPAPTEKLPPTEFPPERPTGQYPEPGSFEDHGLKPPPPNEPLQPIETPATPKVYTTPETPFDEPFPRGPVEVHGPPPPPEAAISPATERLPSTEFPPERPTGQFGPPTEKLPPTEFPPERPTGQFGPPTEKLPPTEFPPERPTGQFAEGGDSTRSWKPGEQPYMNEAELEDVPTSPNEDWGTRLPNEEHLTDPTDLPIDPITGKPFPEGGAPEPQVAPPAQGPEPAPGLPTKEPDPTPQFKDVPIDPNEKPGTRLPYRGIDEVDDPPIDPITEKPFKP
jgi:hypothetical protein